jgi:superfamily I DNA/RNA helicase
MMYVVNHILEEELMLNRYVNECLDYMLTDEVQDLTPATIYLITKMTKRNVFNCGDTIQAISKGVVFKFSSIKISFRKKYFKHYIDKEIIEKNSTLQSILDLTTKS